MEYNSTEIKKGIKVHFIQTELFKTNLISIFVSKKLSKDNVTMNTLIPAVLRRGTENMPSQEKISMELENLYGAEFDCGVDKTGDNHVLKFYIESINNNYIITDEDILQQSIENILEIVFNPILENEVFKKEYVVSEKEKIKQLIESKIDNKDKYSIERCIEELYKGELYGLYKFGRVEDLENINQTNLYKEYQNLINTAKIDIFISGEFNQQDIINTLKTNKLIEKLPERNPDYVINDETTEVKQLKEENIVTEQLEVGQGKLVIGVDILENKKDSRYAISLYNTILGGSPNSKLFQNVREKESLAYSIGSIYLKTKNNIFVKAGIEIENYEKALDLIKQQIENMKKGDFTEKDLENAKKFMIYGIKAIIEEQETGITYYIGQELAGTNVNPMEYIDKINSITMEDVKNIANKVNINTVYFLKN